MNCIEQERILEAAFKDISGKIAELWKVEKAKAPKLVIRGDFNTAEADNILSHYNFYTSTGRIFDEFEALDLRHIMYWTALKYLNAVNPALLERYKESSRCTRGCIL